MLGICNGFQICSKQGCYRGHAPEQVATFHLQDVSVKVENAPRRLPVPQSGQVLKIPIAHADGNYYTDPVTLAAMQANAQIVPAIARRRAR